MSTYINYAVAGAVPNIATRSRIEASDNIPAGTGVLRGVLPRRKADALDDVAAQSPKAKDEFVRSVKRCKRSDEDVNEIRKRLANLSLAPIATATRRIRREGEAVRLRKRFLKRARLLPAAVAINGGPQYAFTFSPMLIAVAQPASTATEDIDVAMSASSDELCGQDVTMDQQQARGLELFSVQQVVGPAGVRGASGPVSTDTMEIEDKPRTDLAFDNAASNPQDDVDQVMVPVDMSTFVTRFLALQAAKSTPPTFLPFSSIHGASKTSHRSFTPIGTPYFKSYTPPQQAPTPLALPENLPGRPRSPTPEEIALSFGVSEDNVVEVAEEESLFTSKTSAANSPRLDFLDEEGSVSPTVEGVALDICADAREHSALLEEDLFSECADEAYGESPSQANLPRVSSHLVLPETGESWAEVDGQDSPSVAVGWLAPAQSVRASDVDDLFIEDAGDVHEYYGPYSPVRSPVEVEEDVFGPVLLLEPRQREYAAQIVSVGNSHPIDADWSQPRSHDIEAEDIADEIMHGDRQEEFFSLPPSPSPSSPLLSSTAQYHSGSQHFIYRLFEKLETKTPLAGSLPSLCSMDSTNSSSDDLLADEFLYGGMVSNKVVVDPRMWHFRESRIIPDFEDDDEAVVVNTGETPESTLVSGATNACVELLVPLLDKWTCEDACYSPVPSHPDSLFSSDSEIWYDALDDDTLISPAMSLGDLDQMVCDPATADMDTLTGYACSSVPPSPARSPAGFLRDLDFAFASPPQAIPGDYDAPSWLHSSPRPYWDEWSSLVPNSPLALAASPVVDATDAFWGSPSLFDLDSAQPTASPEPYVSGPCDALEALRRDVRLTCAASPAQSHSSLFDAPQDDLALSDLQSTRSAYFGFDESAAPVSPALSPIPSPAYVLPGAWQDSLDSMDDIQI
ncbi:hypothetical protein GY45DRAFT_1435836 [Cubamyces sp. BRFM 1775]|nr:hypothetical protein GY45DRAFT_1435836 [Cubamyces sp. BRFM 1775]